MRSPSVHSSSPAVAASSAATTSTAAFQPPGGNWLLAYCQSDANNGSNDEQHTVSTTTPGITWVENIFDNANGGACISIWSAFVASSVSLSVDMVSNKGSVAKRLLVRVMTDCGGVGAVANAHAATVNYVATMEGSVGWAAFLGANTLPVAGSGQTIVDETAGFDSGDSVATVMQNAPSLAGATVTMNVTGPAGVHIGAVELLPVADGQPTPPLPPHLLIELLTQAAGLFGGAAVSTTQNTNDAGTTTVPLTSGATAVRNATTVAGTSRLPAITRAAAVKNATVAGACSLPLRAAGLPVHGVSEAGRSTSAFTAAGSDTGGGHPQTGTTGLPLLARSSAVRAALPTGRTSPVVTGTTVAKRAALPAGVAAVALRTVGTVVRQAIASAAGRIALRASGAAGKSTQAAGRTTVAITAVRSSGAQPAAPVPGRAILGTTSSANTIDTTTAARASSTTSAAAATTRTVP